MGCLADRRSLWALGCIFMVSVLEFRKAWPEILPVPSCGRLLRSTCPVDRLSRPPLSGALGLGVTRDAADDCSAVTRGSAFFGHIALLLSWALGNFQQHLYHYTDDFLSFELSRLS